MSQVLFEFTAVLFYILLISAAFSWMKLWEDKEYSGKRMLIHLKETRQGLNILFGPASIAKWLLIFIYGITIFVNGFDIYYHIAVSLLYFLLFLNLIRKIYLREFLIHKFSYFAIIIVSSSILFETLLFLFAPLDRFLWLLLLDKILPLLIATFVFASSIFLDFNADIVINRALKKIQNHKNLLVIAVVGSYGKGTTKEFISQVLSSKFNVLAAHSSFNTAMGIARLIIKELSVKKQILIAEMEDYKYGEIREMCNVIIPKIVVVAGINDQNIAMFGNMDKLLDSKFQAIESLSQDGIGLFNGNSSATLLVYKKTKHKKFVYCTEESKIKHPDIRAFNIKLGRFSTSFSIEVFRKRYEILNVKLLGRQSIENLLPAIFIGLYIGIDFSLLRKLISEIKPLPGTMSPGISPKKFVLIDDTYNSNINSVERALDYIKIYRGKKVFVMEPLTELGQNAKQDHASLGEKIGEVCDFLFLTNNNYSDQVVQGVKKSGDRCKVLILSPSKVAGFIEHECKKQDVVVFEGRGARASLLAISSDSVY